ncbi:hypothetical protein ACVWYF_004015 [Hymenobacter sp. UYAg731]
MAKTFKNLPSPTSMTSAKRASERDFFDLTDDPQPDTIPEVTPTADPASGNTDNTRIQGNIDNHGVTDTIIVRKKTIPAEKRISVDNTGNVGTTSNGDGSGNTASSEIPVAVQQAELSGDARQTFVLSRMHLEQLRDHVHARRAGGDYTYSQKQALQDALDLLFASNDSVAPRPEQAREREQQRRERIQQGRLPRT